jgi:hypothetical protein
VWRAAGVFLFVAMVAGRGHGAEPALRYPLEKELAWARASWPDDLKGVHFHSLAGKLLAWIPASGALTVFLYTDELSCRRATLSRAERPRDGDADPDESSSPVGLQARIIGRSRMEDGERVRDVRLVQVGHLLSQEDSAFTIEAQGAGGKWQEVGGGAGSDAPTVYGALSYVDDRVARWDGAPLDIQPYCAGPVEWLACPAGGERPCPRCEQVGLLLLPLDGLGGHSISYGTRAVTCHDPCPKYPESPAMARVSSLADRTQPWQPRHTPLSQVPSLYRSRDECRRDHPGAR